MALAALAGSSCMASLRQRGADHASGPKPIKTHLEIIEAADADLCGSRKDVAVSLPCPFQGHDRTAAVAWETSRIAHRLPTDVSRVALYQPLYILIRTARFGSELMIWGIN
jgi:hypothetical protein